MPQLIAVKNISKHFVQVSIFGSDFLFYKGSIIAFRHGELMQQRMERRWGSLKDFPPVCAYFIDNWGGKDYVELPPDHVAHNAENCMRELLNMPPLPLFQ